jgi:hypothetical protein
LGRYLVEVHGDRAQVVMIGAGAQLRDRAVAALRQMKPPFPQERDPWPAGPVIDRDSAGGPYRGRVVIEMWSAATNVAVSSGRSSSELIERAATDLSKIWVR